MTTVRWQDWTSVALGCWLVISPWILGHTLNSIATENACGVGIVVAVFNLISACRLEDKGQEIFNVLLGSWLALSPFSLNFAAERAATINAILLGTVIIVLAVWQIYDSIKAPKT